METGRRNIPRAVHLADRDLDFPVTREAALRHRAACGLADRRMAGVGCSSIIISCIRSIIHDTELTDWQCLSALHRGWGCRQPGRPLFLESPTFPSLRISAREVQNETRQLQPSQQACDVVFWVGNSIWVAECKQGDQWAGASISWQPDYSTTHNTTMEHCHGTSDRGVTQ